MHHGDKFLAIIILFAILTNACQQSFFSRSTTAEAPQSVTTNRLLNAAKLIAVDDFGANPGNITMYKYVPKNIKDKMPENAPLVVSLHGCKQNAAIYAQNGWLDLAEQWNFYLLFPEQNWWNNPNYCWNWFYFGDNRRGAGEAQSIRNMIAQMVADHNIDESRIFVEGLSAGGYMTANLLAAYPDIFAAGGINAGGPAYCSSYVWAAWSCMDGYFNLSPTAWATLVHEKGFNAYDAWPKVSIWHGTGDTRVDIANQRELVEQWTALHDIDQTADLTNTAEGYPHAEYHDVAGTVLVETYTIPEMAHGIAVDPDFTSVNGCGAASDYLLDANICAVYYLGHFFGLDQAEPMHH